MSSRGERKENISTLPGNIALIPCDLPFDLSVPRAQVSFLLNSSALQLRADKHLISSDGKLLIKQVKNTDAGVYQCVLSNRDANVSLRSNVEYALLVPVLRRATPVLLHKSSSLVRSMAGDNVTLLCIYSGNPVPAVEWEKSNGAGLWIDQSRLSAASERYVVDPKGYVHIANVSYEDAGVYRCKYTHERGGTTESFTLQVDGPPSVTLTTPVVPPTAKGLTLRCDVARASNSYWLLNGERLNNGDLSIRLSTTSKRSGDEMHLLIPFASQQHRGMFSHT